LALIIRDYQTVMTWATPADADQIDKEFWGSVFFPSHYASAQTIALRVREATLASVMKEPKSADETQTDTGTKRTEASTTPKRAKS
jgi:hypothetical protein